MEDGEEADESDTDQQPARDGKTKTALQQPSQDEPEGEVETWSLFSE